MSEAGAEEECISLPQSVEAAIKAHNDDVYGEEACEWRQVVKGDVNKDGREDYVVHYLISGACYESGEEPPGACGNQFSGYLALFLQKKDGFTASDPVHVSGKFWREVEEIKIKDHAIVVNYLDLEKMDASRNYKPGKAVYKVKGHQIENERVAKRR
ncbi:MAG: hypothetical protein G8345_06355 [Magnetococcales bacterium]|nr:hypothetical protein [Magnetococcales bacterium]NGZ26492.1 hypothetical protein [Magnetococcales bacterium]